MRFELKTLTLERLKTSFGQDALHAVKHNIYLKN